MDAFSDFVEGVTGYDMDGDGSCDPQAPVQCIMETSHITIIEKVSLIEAATALMGQEVEMANNYKIVDADGDPIFYASEQTDCFMRQVKQCCGDCAPWNVDIRYTKGGSNALVYKIQRPWTFTCLCFNRPKAELTDEMNGGATIATISDPWVCCNDMTFTVQNSDEEDILYVKGGCCQLGLFFPLPCGPCSEVHFSIENTDGQEVGHLTKKVPGCCKFFLAPDVDNYEIDLAELQGLDQRLSMIMLAIFVDFRYFNDNSNDDNDGGGGGEE